MSDESAETEEPLYCDKCTLRIGVGCACDLTFAEKMKTIQIDKHSLRQPYYPGRRGER